MGRRKMDLAVQQKQISFLRALGREERQAVRNNVPSISIAGVDATVLAAPVVLERLQFDALVNSAQCFVDSAIAIETHSTFIPGMKLYDLLYASLSKKGKNLIDRAGRPSPTAVKRRLRRLDGYCAGIKQPMFIEMNQSAPLAISFYETARRYTQSLGTSVAAASLYDDMALWFIEELKCYGYDGDSAVVAVSVERGYPAKFVDLPMACTGISEAALRYGIAIEFVIAEPTDFLYASTGRMMARGREFDLLWRNTVYLDNYSETLNEYEKFRYVDNPMVNDLYAWLFRSKAFFAMIWDDELADDFGRLSVDVQALRAATPETIWLRDAMSISDRHEWILKRCDDGFGKGVVFGSEVSDCEWNAYCRGEHGDDWVVQRVIRPKSMEVPIIDEKGGLVEVEVVCDFDPFVVNGSVSGVLVRALPANRIDKKMNIVEGALIGYAAARKG